MTREEIEARIKLLTQKRDDFIAESHALNGAIKDCEFWLSRLESQAEGEEAPLPKPSLVE